MKRRSGHHKSGYCRAHLYYIGNNGHVAFAISCVSIQCKLIIRGLLESITLLTKDYLKDHRPHHSERYYYPE